MDGSLLDVPVLGAGRRVLVVADLGARATIACRSISQECAAETTACLEALIAARGAPLALKVDNGPAFIAASFQALCDRYGIVLLYSPARRPSFNGAIEARVRWVKEAIYASAADHGRHGYVRAEDLEVAIQGLGCTAPLPAERRAEFRRTFAKALRAVRNDPRLVPRGKTRHARRASLRRVAAQRALEECHILTIRRPEFRQWLPPREWG